MRVHAECLCGWKQSLSEFYAGKRLRCPECAAIVDVPASSSANAAGSYHYQPLANWPNAPRVTRQGRWVSVHAAARRDRRGRVAGVLFGMFLCTLAIVQVLDPFNVRERERPARDCQILMPEPKPPAGPDADAAGAAQPQILPKSEKLPPNALPAAKPAKPEAKPAPKPAPGSSPGTSPEVEDEF